MKFIEGFFALLAIAVGMIFAAMHFVMNWFLGTAMIAAGSVIIALDAFALIVWFVNWKYYPEER
jgi:hypothetical protein